MSDFIVEIVKNNYPQYDAREFIKNSYLIEYLEKKTGSVKKGSKARGSFANLYAIYVLVEDYINNGYNEDSKDYSQYEGMKFTNALKRTRQLPFGEKLQNHALNDRCNDEFKKYYNAKTDEVPIIRDLSTKRYWINEKLLFTHINGETINISSLCMEIVDTYVKLKMDGFKSFFNDLNELKNTVNSNPQEAIDFIASTLNPSSDARIFEIVSFVIIKYYFIDIKIKFAFSQSDKEYNEHLMVYKVGRTNANDGGIDYIMKPLGRIFQVTEVLEFKKYFLDIDKLLHYPITFVVKQDISPKTAMEQIIADASNEFTGDTLKHYLDCFEEIITIPILKQMLGTNIENNHLPEMIDEFITQCKVEYNIK